MMMRFVVLVFLGVVSGFVDVTLMGEPEDRIPGEYVVKFQDDAVAEFAKLKDARTRMFNMTSLHEFGDYMGFGGALDSSELAMVQAFPGVEYIEQNMIFRALGEQINVQATGIDRSDQRGLPLNRIYRWTDGAAGQGVDIFILDTGINTNHADFAGRAQFVADCSGNTCNTGTNTLDPHGHGTHCAGTAVSNTYGIAKFANVFNVRVLGANGSGSTNGIINGISIVNQRAGKRVISLSLGGGFSAAFNNAIDASHRAGVINVVAAGNSNSDACNSSPSSAALAVTVAATDINDRRATFSSFGSCCDVFAPGVNILSTGGGGGTAVFSGTSMSCPHVAGAVALIHSRGNFSADQVVAILLQESTLNVVTNPGVGTPNRLMFTNPQ